jgi:hypothetical protein
MSKDFRSSYIEKLRNPKWQKRRLDIMSRDEFTCQSCNDSQSTLNVHHMTYVYGLEPWDYPDTNFITLCEYCHSEEELCKVLTKHFITESLLKGISNKRLFLRLCDSFGIDGNRIIDSSKI